MKFAIVTLLKKPVFFFFCAYLAHPPFVNKNVLAVLTRTQLGNFVLKGTPTPHGLATSDRDARLSLPP